MVAPVAAPPRAGAGEVGPFRHGETQPLINGDDAIADQAQGVARARRQRVPGKRQVDGRTLGARFGRQPFMIFIFNRVMRLYILI